MQYHRLYPGSEDDINDLQKIFEAATSYYIQMEGNPPGPNAALEALQKLPPGKIADDKYFFGIKLSSEFIGCFDVVRDYPELKIAFIGLLLFVESEQSKSHGVQALQYIKSMARQWGCFTLRIAVIANNQRALTFWKREGFIELYRKPSEQYSSDAIIMEYALTKKST
jgi:diamine N-acetyltransferase